MTDRFGRYLGKLDMEVAGEKLELDIKLKDKHRIMALQSKMGKEMNEEVVGQLSDIFLEVLKRSYPEEKPEALEAFLTRCFEQFIIELSVAFGWTTREQLKRGVEGEKK